MKFEKLSNAFNEISDTHIAEAAAPKRKIKLPWLGAVAAILVLAICITAIGRPMTASAEGLIAAPTYPKEAMPHPAEGYASSAEGFFRESTATLLGSGEASTICSPLNIYMALSMLAETTAEETQAELLNLLGSDSLDSLRTQAGRIWNAHYRDDEKGITTLANSLWLDNAYDYNEDTVKTLAESYYTSVYRGDLGTKDMDKLLQDWLNRETKNLLQEQSQEIELSQDTLLALASTIYYKVAWSDEFNKVNNFQDVFHSPNGDIDATYMYKAFLDSPHYRGENFGAVVLRLRDSSKMWLILPDKGYTANDILSNNTWLDMVYDSESSRQVEAAINLSMPKFDVVSNLDLVSALQSMGLTDIFDPITADFTPILPDEENAYVREVSHAARILVDEKGVTGATYTVIAADGAAADYDKVVEFVLDRPFIFCVQSRDNLPLFAGIVTEP